MPEIHYKDNQDGVEQSDVNTETTNQNSRDQDNRGQANEKEQTSEKDVSTETDCISQPVTPVKPMVAEVIDSDFNGLIPSPNLMKGYEEVLPGSANRIISLTERETKHRETLEKERVRLEARNSLISMICSFGLALGCIVAAIVMTIIGPGIAGLIAGAILGVVGVISDVVILIVTTKRTNSKKGKHTGRRVKKSND